MIKTLSSRGGLGSDVCALRGRLQRGRRRRPVGMPHGGRRPRRQRRERRLAGEAATPDEGRARPLLRVCGKVSYSNAVVLGPPQVRVTPMNKSNRQI